MEYYSRSYIPPHRTQIHPRMYSSSKPPPSSAASRDKYWLLAAAALVSPFVFYLFATARGVHLSSKFAVSTRPAASFGVVIHAASSATTLRVFESLGEGPIPFVAHDGGGGGNVVTSKPGLAAFVDRPEAAGDSIRVLLDFARRRVPRKDWGVTTVRLMATGELASGERRVSDRILESCRRVLRASSFSFKGEWASLITGQEEGVYAWVAANYALGTLGADPQKTTGVVNLGGASAQVTLVSREPPPIEFSRNIKLAGVSYNLYCRSTTQFGQEAVWKSLIEHHISKVSPSFRGSVEGIASSPCIPRGYTHMSNLAAMFNASQNNFLPNHSAGNFSACRSEILTFLQNKQELCTDPPCKELSLMPYSHARSFFVENLFYVSELFGMEPRASLAEIEAVGQQYCGGNWVDLRKRHESVEETELLRYCFSTAYIVALLHDGLGISMQEKRIGFSNHEVSAHVDWTLGAFILHTTMVPQPEAENLSDIVGDESVTHLSFFAVLFLVILAAFFISKCRKPQMKTVYDLEKGHYIVTRIPR